MTEFNAPVADEATEIDEKCLLKASFNEGAYLKANPDVAAAVEIGALTSGLAHWEAYGYDEEVKGIRAPHWKLPLSLTDIKDALTLQPSDLIKIIEALGHNASDLDLQIFRQTFVSDWLNVGRRLKKVTRKPLISVILPVYNTEERWLRLSIESVLLQIYDNWELCIVDDNSPGSMVRDIIIEYANREPRIKYYFRNENGHISAASNDALAIASGEYIALLDHDDELTPDALAQVVFKIHENPDVDFIYSDEDKIDETGRIYGRILKPQWSPELILSCGYTTHLSVYSRRIVESVQGFRSEFDGAQDYDLALRVSEQTDQIEHIPEAIYHWRAIDTSTAKSGDAKSYALPRAEAALTEHMSRLGRTGKLGSATLKGYTCFVPEIVGTPLVSIVIPTAGKIADIEGNKVNFIQNCVSSIIERSSYKAYEVIVSHNGNLSEETLSFLNERSIRLLRYDEKIFNLAQKINLATDYAVGEYLLILNDDTEVISSNWIEELLRFNQLEGVGAVGAKLLFGNDTIQHIGVSIIGGAPGHPMAGEPRNSFGHLGLATVPHNVSAVTGACMMTRANLFRTIGGFDVEFDLNYNDVDYCLKLREQGYRIVINPKCELYHYESVSRDVAKGTVRPDELRLFLSRWGEAYQRERYVRG